MAKPPFESCWHRIKRAKAHREAIAKMWKDVAKEDYYNVGLGMDDGGTGAIWVTPTYGKALPDVFALQIGEILYHLRAALDACIYEAAILETGKNPPPDENRLEFPMCRSNSEYAKKAAFMLRSLAKGRRAIVESVQPYNVPRIAPELMVFNFNRTLGILNDWARKDRHRRLHVVGSWASNANPKVRCPPERTLRTSRYIARDSWKTRTKSPDFDSMASKQV